MLDQVTGPLASFTGDGAYDQAGISASVAECHPEAAFVGPPRFSAVPGETAGTAPTQRERHLEYIAAHGRTGWQKALGYTLRARAETAMSSFKQVIGDDPPSRMDKHRETELAVAVRALSRMLDFGRLVSVRLA